MIIYFYYFSFFVVREFNSKQNFKISRCPPGTKWDFQALAHNGLALGEEADFEALNCLPALNVIRRTKLHLSTEPAFFCQTHVSRSLFFRSF
jgi:hypothetical protein